MGYKSYAPWYDYIYIRYVMFRFGFNRDDAVDYIYLSYSPIERLRYRVKKS